VNKINPRFIYSRIFLFCFIVFYFCTCGNTFSQQPRYEVTTTKYLLGTQIDITGIHSDIDSLKKAMYYAYKEIERIQGVMSIQIDTTEVSRINHNSGISPVKVSYETYSIISRSIEYSQKYNGMFDITIGPISDLWGFSSEHKINSVPDRRIVDSLIKLVDYKLIRLNPADTSVYLPLKRMMIDLGGIAKGYAVDRASEVMKKNGMKDFFINAGGDLYVSGMKTDEQQWSVGIKAPRDESKIFARMNVKDMAVGTSGDYERYVIIDGKRYHHIFNTKTGYPVMISQSATAIANTTEEAVVLSKIVFIYGADEYMKTKQLTGILGALVDSTGNIVYDERLKENNNFEIVK